jgi:hypothetical protein
VSHRELARLETFLAAITDCAIGTFWVDVRGTAEQPPMHVTPPSPHTRKYYLIQNLSNSNLTPRKASLAICSSRRKTMSLGRLINWKKKT